MSSSAIAVVAHDAKTDALIAWANAQYAMPASHRLSATGTTGGRINAETAFNEGERA